MVRDSDLGAGTPQAMPVLANSDRRSISWIAQVGALRALNHFRALVSLA